MAAIGPHFKVSEKFGAELKTLTLNQLWRAQWELEVAAIAGVSLRVIFAILFLFLCISNFLIFRKRDF